MSIENAAPHEAINAVQGEREDSVLVSNRRKYSDIVDMLVHKNGEKFLPHDVIWKLCIRLEGSESNNKEIDARITVV